jgi:FkbM family methyltransferase
MGSMLFSAKRRGPCLIRYSDGTWIHRYRTGVVVDSNIGGQTTRVQDRDTWDVFLYGYRPKPGDTVLDLGAGIGGEVRVLSRLAGPSGRVVSVEAHPRTFRCLRRTIELNRLYNVTPLQCAVTGTPGTVLISDQDNHSANGLTTDRAQSLEVPGKTLPEIVKEFGLHRIDLLKMNIEGAELSVLESAREVLPRVRNLVVSCHDFLADNGGGESARTFAGVRALLGAAGYTIQTRPADARPWIRYYVYASR